MHRDDEGQCSEHESARPAGAHQRDELARGEVVSAFEVLRRAEAGGRYDQWVAGFGKQRKSEENKACAGIGA